VKTIEISEQGKWISVPAIEIAGRTVVVTGRSVRIATVHDEYWMEDELEDPALYIRSLKEQRSRHFQADIFTFGQKLNAGPSYPYHQELESLAAIRVDSFDEWWKKLPAESRRNVKASKNRGLVTKVQEFNEDLVRGIVEINNEVPIRQGRRFWHYGKDFDAVMKDYVSYRERSHYIGAYFQDELVAFMKIVYVGNVAAIMQNLSKLSHRDKKPANALIARAVELCAEKNLSLLTYFQYRYGNKREDPLTEFKRRNGFEEFFTPRYYVPLTLKGSAALALRLHHSLGEILPAELLDVLRNLRTRWYNWPSHKPA
jgi:hypothetical protein